MDNLEKEKLLIKKIENIPYDNWVYIDKNKEGDEVSSDNYLITSLSNLKIKYHTNNMFMEIIPAGDNPYYFEDKIIKKRAKDLGIKIFDYVKLKDLKKRRASEKELKEKQEHRKNNSLDNIINSIK